MLRNIASALFLLVLVSCSPEKTEGPAYWVIADEDTTLTLFGTVHLLKPETKWGMERFQAMVKASDSLILELDQAQMSDEAMMPLVIQYGLYPAGDSLDQHVSDEVLKDLQGWADKIGLPMVAIQQMRPWMADLTVSVSALQMKGYDPNAGVETIFEAAANSAGVPIKGLEKALDQIEVFATLSQDHQIKMLTENLANIATMEEDMLALTRAWVTGDTATLSALMNADMEEDPKFAEAILYRRNRNWISHIEQVMATSSGNHFMAVGAGHLVGDKSVIDLLEQAGWTVTRQ